MRYIVKRRFPVRYRRSAGKKRGFRRWLIPVLAGGLFLWLALSEIGLSSVSQELTEEAARSYLISSMDRAVKEELGDGESSFVQIARTGDGRVSDLSADAGKLNGLKSGVLSRLKKDLNGSVSAYVPIGSLTGVGVLNGRGPMVPVKLKLEGSANVSFQSEFDSAGVNQSVHRITMTVSARAYSQSKRFEARVEEETTAVLAETVLVGQVPQVALTAG